MDLYWQSNVSALFFNMLSRLIIGEGNGTPLQYSGLQNCMNYTVTCSHEIKRHLLLGRKAMINLQFSSVQSLSHRAVTHSFQPHGLQHARLPCPSPTPRAYLNSCPLSQWCHPTISSSVIPFSSCLQSFPASGSFQMSQFFTSGGQSVRVSASTSVLPMNVQDWFPLGWTAVISLQEKGLSRVFSNTTVRKHQFFGAQLSLASISHYKFAKN